MLRAFHATSSQGEVATAPLSAHVHCPGVCLASATATPPTLSRCSFACCPSGNHILIRPPWNRVQLRCTVPACGRRPRVGRTATPEFEWHLTSMHSRGSVSDGMRASIAASGVWAMPYVTALRLRPPALAACHRGRHSLSGIFGGVGSDCGGGVGQGLRPSRRCLVWLGRSDRSVDDGRGIDGLTQPPPCGAADAAPNPRRERIERRQPWRRPCQQRRRGSVVSLDRNLTSVLSLFQMKLQGWPRRGLRRWADQGPLQSNHQPAKIPSQRVILCPPPALLPGPYFPSWASLNTQYGQRRCDAAPPHPVQCNASLASYRRNP